MKNVYDGGFADRERMMEAFEVSEKELEGYNVVYAYYEDDCYDGSAFVLLEKNGEYFEVNGSHCSCYGLEGQFDLEATTAEALKHRADEGHSYGAFASSIPSLKEHFGW